MNREVAGINTYQLKRYPLLSNPMLASVFSICPWFNDQVHESTLSLIEIGKFDRNSENNAYTGGLENGCSVSLASFKSIDLSGY